MCSYLPENGLDDSKKSQNRRNSEIFYVVTVGEEVEDIVEKRLRDR